jgi:hypothetical protein
MMQQGIPYFGSGRFVERYRQNGEGEVLEDFYGYI